MSTTHSKALVADPKLTHISKQLQHTSPFISCRFDPTGQFVYGTAEDMTIQRWRLADGKKVSYPAVHDSWVRGLAFLDGGKTLVSAGYDGRLIWWSATSDKPVPLRKVKAHHGWIRYLDARPDGKLLATGGHDRVLKIWSATDGKLIRELPGHQNDIYSTFFHPKEPVVLSGDLSGVVKQWDLKTGKEIRIFDAKELHTYNGGQQVHYGGVRSMSISPDGSLLSCSGLHKAPNPLGAVNEPDVLAFDWKTGKLKTSHITSNNLKGIAWRACYHPQGFLVACSGGSGGGHLLFWKPGQAKEFHRVNLKNTARDLDLHPSGIMLATAHHDRRIRISTMQKKAVKKKT